MPKSLTRALVGALALATATTLAACGGEDAAPSTTNTRVVLDIDEVAVEVPEDPQRVVTLSEPTLDGVLALGLTPVGTVAGRGQSGVPGYLAGDAEGVEIIGTVAQPDYEAIGAVKPDLILVDGTSINNNPDAIAALSRIAPVVYTGYAGGSWVDNFTIVGDALNRADEAAAVIEDYQAEAKRVGDELAETYGDDTFSIVRWQGNAPSMILKELPAGRALEDLGLKRPESQDTYGRGHSEPVSLENLSLIDADHMFFGTLGGSSVANPEAGGASDVQAAEAALATAVEVPGFTSLDAYRNNSVIPVDGSLWTSTGGPLLMQRIVADVERALL